MKIRLGLIDQNKEYASRLMTYFSTHFSDQVDMFMFNGEESFNAFAVTKRLDVVIADPEAVSEEFKAPRNVIFAFFSDSKDVDTIRGFSTVCRYQKAELIFKEVVKLYSELDHDKTYKTGEEKGKIISFFGAAGGVGTTTVSVACAKALAAMDRKVVYINFEQNGITDHLLAGEGTSSMSDVLYALKSKRANLSLKLSSMLREDECGVNYFSPYEIMLDSLELGAQDAANLIEAVTSMGSYEYIVTDLGSAFDACAQMIMNESSLTFLICSGADIANAKLARLARALELRDASSQGRILSHTNIIYNKVDAKAKEMETDPFIGVFGRVGLFQRQDAGSVSEQIAASSLFKDIV